MLIRKIRTSEEIAKLSKTHLMSFKSAITQKKWVMNTDQCLYAQSYTFQWLHNKSKFIIWFWYIQKYGDFKNINYTF